MPIQVQYVGSGVSANASSSVNTFDVNLPTELQAGDLLVVQLIHRVTGGTITAPNGWTIEQDVSNGYRFVIATKKYVPGDGNPTFTFSVAAGTSAKCYA